MTGRGTTPAGKDLRIGEYVFALSSGPRVSKQGSVISIQSALEYASDPNLNQDKPITTSVRLC